MGKNVAGELDYLSPMILDRLENSALNIIQSNDLPTTSFSPSAIS
jgi:hypothetical protein